MEIKFAAVSLDIAKEEYRENKTKRSAIVYFEALITYYNDYQIETETFMAGLIELANFKRQ